MADRYSEHYTRKGKYCIDYFTGGKIILHKEFERRKAAEEMLVAFGGGAYLAWGDGDTMVFP